MQKVNLNLIPGGVRPVINVSQYDEGRQFQLAIFNGSASYDLTGKTVIIEVGKLDGNGVAYDETDEVNNVPVVAISGNIVTITTPKQMTAVAGQNNAELKISDSTAVIGTLNFLLDCEQSALSPDTPLSDTEIPALEELASQSAQKALNAVSHYPYIDDTTKNWFVWDVETGAFVDTGVRAQGIDGEGSVKSVNNVSPDADGDVSLGLSDITTVPITTANGGTGNSNGYIRTGQKSGTATSATATIEGTENEAHGNSSHAEGYMTNAYSNYTHAEGVGTLAQVVCQHVQGYYNNNKNDTMFEIGNGSDANTRHNLMEVHDDGRIVMKESDAVVTGGNLAPVVELTRTMSAQRTAGSYVFVVADKKTYYIDSTIAASGTLTPGTNATEVTTFGEVAKISSDLASVQNNLKCWHFTPAKGDNVTDIDVNAGSYGKTLFVIISQQTGTGDTTHSVIGMLRCGYDGNHVTWTLIAGAFRTTFEVTFSANSDGKLVITQLGAKVSHVMIISNRIGV